MLRELIDIASLEDFIAGLAHASGRSIGVYDADGSPLVHSPPMSQYARLVAASPKGLPAAGRNSPANEPERVRFVHRDGVWRATARVTVAGERAGAVCVGEYAGAAKAKLSLERIAAEHGVDAAILREAWGRLPRLDRTQHGSPAVQALWIARTLRAWCERESQTRRMSEELDLIGRIAERLTRDESLQSVLDAIVAETARVMKCRFASIRLYHADTDELTIAAVHNLSERYLKKGRIVRSENPLDNAALRGETVYIEDARYDPRIRFRADARRERIISSLTTGMIYRGRGVGVIRVYTDRIQQFSRIQHDLLRAVASQAAAAITHSQLIQERLRDAAVDRQLELAGQVQSRMIPAEPPRYRGYEVAMVFEPSLEVAGDFYDYMTLPDGRLLLVVADAVGKGVPASLLIASLRGALRANAYLTGDLGEILTRLNRHVYRETGPGEFVTLLAAAVGPDRRRICYCNAGHEQPLLLRAGRVRALSEGGLVLGAEPDEEYRESCAELRGGDVLLFYSDGAAEAMNFEGELFGRRRLRRSLAAYGTQPPQQLIKNIVWDIRRFTGLAEQSDDLTMVGLRVADAEH